MNGETNRGAAGGEPAAGGSEGLVPEAEEIMRSPAAGPTSEAAPAAEQPGAEALAEARREADEHRQAMLRALAEAENVRRRAQRDVADAKSYAIASFARDLLNVSDNFKRALSAAEKPDAPQMSDEMKSLLEGVKMTERELNTILTRHGVTIVEPEGERFDPNRHQAMYEIENAEVPSGTVLQVMQAGAVIGERVLRPAMVGVSKGGPKPGAAQSAADPTPAEPESTADEGASG